MTAPTAKPGIMNIRPYVAGESDVEGLDEVVKVSSNESALGASPKAIEAFQSIARDLHRYPDGGANRLRRGLAEFHDLNAENIICGNGSDELISQLIQAYAGAGDEVLYSEFGFLMYPLGAMAAGATPVAAREDDYTASVDALLAAVTERTKIVFLANPNNPTGTYLSSVEVTRLRDGLPAQVLLALDCAYAEYVMRNDYSPGIEMVEAHDNVVMLRTFSKIYGLAALRLGWAYCPPEVAGVLNRVRGPFNVNMAAQLAGLAAMRDVEYTDRARLHNDEWMPWLSDAFAKLGLMVIPSVGNFVTVGFPESNDGEAERALEFLKQRGVIGRGIAAYGLTNHIRFTVGRSEENRRIVAGLEEFLGRGDRK